MDSSHSKPSSPSNKFGVIGPPQKQSTQSSSYSLFSGPSSFGPSLLSNVSNSQPNESQRNKAATTIQKAFRGFKARNATETLREQRQQTINTALTDDSNRKTGGNFTIKRTFKEGEVDGSLANKTLFRRDDKPDKGFTSYIQYDQHGGPIKRVDLTGADHAGVPTPHVLEYRREKRDIGQGKVLYQYSAPENNLVRSAYPWELPNDRQSQLNSSTLSTPVESARKKVNNATYQQGFKSAPKKVQDFWTKK